MSLHTVHVPALSHDRAPLKIDFQLLLHIISQSMTTSTHVTVSMTTHI